MTLIEERTVPVHWFAGRVHEVLDEVMAGGVPVVASLTAREAAETITELRQAVARIDGLLLRVLAHADSACDPGADGSDVARGVAGLTGATSTAAWLAHATRTPHRAARRQLRLAERLRSGAFDATASALLEGRIDADQAQVVVEAVDALPSYTSGDERERGESHLLDRAAEFDAKRLAVLGKHLLAVVDPRSAEHELGRAVEAEARAAARRTHLSVWDDGNGTCHGSFRIPSLHGAILTKALHALVAPHRPDALERESEETDEESGETRVRPKVHAELLGEAFRHYLEMFPASKLPRHGGIEATVVVTMELRTLVEGLGVAHLDTGAALTAAEARRIACQAGVIPAVLGGRSEILDIGRRRFFSRPQRIALGVRDQGCTVEGCDRPAGWCHAHHDVPHSRGGPTSLANGRLVCPRHHTLLHHPGYSVHVRGNGRIALSKRCRT